MQAITEVEPFEFVRPGLPISAAKTRPVPDPLLLAIHASEANKEKPPRPGRPVKLFLYCFMNHEYFVLDLKNGKNVICITGENGTGKSALSIAVSFVLGSNASKLGRTSKVEELIMDGRQFAQVDIVLSNTEDWLEEKTYGSYIGIRRIIDRKNCSRFKICKADITKEPKAWKFRDLAKKELMFIKDMLGIMPENPLQILQQVEVTNFQKFSDQNKYSFFYEGVRITSCENLLKGARENMDIVHKNLADIEFELKCNETRILKLETDLQIMEELYSFKKELKWALATEAEEKKKTAETNLTHWTELNKKCEKEQKEANELLKECRLNFKLQECKLRKMMESRQLKDQIYNKKKQELKSADFEIKRMSNTMKNKEKEIRTLKKGFQELQPIRDHLDQKELLQNIKNDILNEINLVSCEIKTIKKLELDRSDYINKCGEAERKLKARQNELKVEIAEKRKEIDYAEMSKGKLHENWPPLIKKFTEIVNSTTFNKKPRGPMCNYIKVKEEKWRSVIEVALHKNLFHFTVDNVEDATLMKAIIVQVFGQGDNVTYGHHITPTIFFSKFLDTKHDISKYKSTGTKYPTIFDMIDIEDDPVVYNWILDTTKIESTLLIEDTRVALQLMSEHRPEIKNCVGAYTSDFYCVTPQPNYARWDNNVCTSKYLQLSSTIPKGQISQLKNQKHLLEKEFTEVVKKLEENFKNSNNERKRHYTVNQKIADKMKVWNQLKYEQTQLKDKLKNLQPDAASMNDEIQNYVKEIKTIEAEYQIYVRQIGIKKEEVQNLKKELRCLDLEKPVLNQKIVTAEDAKKSCAQDETVYKQKLKEHNNTLKNNKNSIKNLEVEIQAVSTIVTLKINEAEQLCPRIVAPRASSLVKFDLDSRKPPQKVCIEEEKKKLKQEMDAKKSQVADKKKHLKTLKMLTDMVLSTILQRETSLEHWKGICASLLLMAFESYMESFGAVGKILISQTDKTLSLDADVGGVSASVDASATLTGSRALARQIRNNISILSGGERTFTTFLFILSTWHVMKCGFFIVDEIDLFLDPVNQQKCQEMLFEFMRETPEATFFHISPHPIKSTIQIPSARTLCIEFKKRESDSDSNNMDTRE